MEQKLLNVYLSGEIHTEWRSEIAYLCEAEQVPVKLISPELDHDKSDNCGEQILGPEDSSFWKDHKAAKINAIRSRGILKSADIVVVRFGEKYKQWNAAFDAGQAVAMGLSLITLHEESLDHALKEIDAAALATTRSVEQLVGILKYVTSRPF